MKQTNFLIFFFLLQTISLSATVRQNLKPPEARIGNFTNDILPSYTFAFGQNIYKKGTTVYNQWGGAGHYLGAPMGLTLMGLIECNGLYNQKDKVDKIKDDNSGGNTLYIGPTLCLTGSRWLLSGGVQFPAIQKLNGEQNKLRFRSSIAATVIF